MDKLLFGTSVDKKLTAFSGREESTALEMLTSDDKDFLKRSHSPRALFL